MKRTEVTLELSRADAWMSAMAITPAQARAASLLLAAHASDAGELRLWLEILGLLPYESGGELTGWGRRSMAKREPAAGTLAPPRCGACGYLVTGLNHKVICDA